MNVEIVLASLCNRRLMVSSRWVALLAAIFFITSFDKRTDRDLRSKQANILIREIGHRLLLQSGDSISRVMPVTEVKEGVFQLHFEKKFQFNPDSLMALAKGLLPSTKFAAGYMVTVHDCLQAGIVYGFMINYNSPDVLACKGRSQPAGCYSIEFSFPDFYDNAALQHIGGVLSNRVVKPDAGELSLPEQGEPGDISTDTDPGSLSARAGNNSSILDLPITLGVIAIMLLTGVGFLLFRARKNREASAAPQQVNAVTSEPRGDLPSLGKYMFDVKGQFLLLGTEMTTLTDKECRVLEILYKNFGELIPRDTLMQEVWLNEGVITGRSLDMFVSKLRKKLSGDPALGITNVHGKGYRLQTIEEIKR